MKYPGKLTVLGAVLAVSASYAIASPLNPLTGSLVIDDAPVTFSSSGGVFDLSTVTNGPGSITEQPVADSGSPQLDTFITAMAVDTFISTQAAGSAIWKGTNSANGDSETFIALAFSPEVPGAGGDFSIVIYGFFEDSGSGTLFTPTAYSDNVTYDASGTSIQEDFSAITPEPNSLILLGTGLLGAAGLFYRRRPTV